mmetsp:Transcript_30541/g.64349  ORF Transcript_30541/g.64349 Transcript_30541/m.64349 type:complete len:501 (+) Transcript_30541:108-1610(+)
MKFASTTTTALLIGAAAVESFSVQPPLARAPIIGSFSRGLAGSSQNDFEFILGEGSSYSEAVKSLRNSRRSSSASTPVIHAPDNSPVATVTLTSSVTASDVFGDDVALEDEVAAMDDLMLEEEMGDQNPLLNNEILKRQHEKKMKKEEFKSAGGVLRYVKNPYLLVKGKDFADVAITVVIPAIAISIALKKGASFVSTKLNDKATDTIAACCNELRYHVGDFETIDRVYKDFSKKLWFHGAPSYIGTEILTEFCKVYPEKVKMSAASIKTFAHVISLTKASDVDFAKCILEACPEGNKHMNRKQQLLFYSDRLLKDKAAKKLLEPFKFDLKTWLGGTEYMMKAQEVIGETAYRFSFDEKAKDQEKLPVGWKVLGLSEEKASQIFEEQKENGFLKPFEYNKKIDKDFKEYSEKKERERWDKLVSEIGYIEASKIDDSYDPDIDYDAIYDNKKGQVRRCQNCGHMLFLSAGVDHEFYTNEDYKCPECGAERKQFKNVINYES